MNWAESVYITSWFRTTRLCNSVVPKLIELGGRTEGLEALDVGCGPGECVACEIDLFGSARVDAIDIDASMVVRARRDWRAALQEIARVLSPGGRFFSQDHDVANHDWIARRLFRHPPDRFSNAEFLEQLAAVDLDVIGVDDQPGQLLVAATKRS